MGLDLSAMWGDAKKAAEQGMQDALNIGGNAALGYLEGQAIGVIQQDQTKHVAEAQRATADILNRPSTPFGDYAKNILSQPVVKQYGVYILGGIGIVVVATLLMRR
jgi:uncharacterized membrane protein YebE (DUF533 family)